MFCRSCESDFVRVPDDDCGVCPLCDSPRVQLILDEDEDDCDEPGSLFDRYNP